MPNDQYFTNRGSTVWVQPGGPNTEMIPLLCHDLDTIDEALGDIQTRYCRDADGTYRVVSRSQGEPSDVTFDVVAWEDDTRDWLQKMKEYQVNFTVYVHKTECGREDVVLNYALGKRALNVLVNNKSSAQNTRRRSDGDTPEMTENTFSLTATPPVSEYYKLDSRTISTPGTEAEPMRALTSCTTPQNRGPCGELQFPLREMHIGADAAASPATPNGYVSTDYVGTWTGWAADPGFLGGLGIGALACIQIDADTERIIAAQGTTSAGNAMVIEYSDDDGATWTTVTVGATVGEFVQHSRCIYALNHRNIWLATDQGAIYFSSDSGVTWTAQSTPTPAAGEGFYGLHFVDDTYGWAVGGDRAAPTGHLVVTVDGGAHWTMATSEPQIEMGTWVEVLDSQDVWIGMDDGTVWYSQNWGTTWTQQTMPQTMVNTGDGRFFKSSQGYTGVVSGYRLVGGHNYPILFRTFDGGNDWETIQHTVSISNAVEFFGVNEIYVGSDNQVVAVGEQLFDGVDMVWYVKPVGASWD